MLNSVRFQEIKIVQSSSALDKNLFILCIRSLNHEIRLLLIRYTVLVLARRSKAPIII